MLAEGRWFPWPGRRSLLVVMDPLKRITATGL